MKRWTIEHERIKRRVKEVRESSAVAMGISVGRDATWPE